MLIKKKLFSELYAAFGVHEEEADIESPQDTVSRAIEEHGFLSGSPGDTDRETLLDEIRQEGEEIIRKSQEEAEQIINAADSQVRERIDSALEEKFKTFDELESRALKELETLLNSQKEVIQDSEKQIIEIAVELASKIVNKTVKEDSSILKNTLRGIVDDMMLSPDETLKINFVVSPLDKAIAEEFAQDMQSKSKQSSEFNVKTDEAISQGSCIIETASGSMDLNFATQLEMFKQRMLSKGEKEEEE
jgi:flagellar assembly protein FliH